MGVNLLWTEMTWDGQLVTAATEYIKHTFGGKQEQLQLAVTEAT